MCSCAPLALRFGLPGGRFARERAHLQAAHRARDALTFFRSRHFPPVLVRSGHSASASRGRCPCAAISTRSPRGEALGNVTASSAGGLGQGAASVGPAARLPAPAASAGGPRREAGGGRGGKGWGSTVGDRVQTRAPAGDVAAAGALAERTRSLWRSAGCTGAANATPPTRPSRPSPLFPFARTAGVHPPERAQRHARHQPAADAPRLDPRVDPRSLGRVFPQPPVSRSTW